MNNQYSWYMGFEEHLPKPFIHFLAYVFVSWFYLPHSSLMECFIHFIPCVWGVCVKKNPFLLNVPQARKMILLGEFARTWHIQLFQKQGVFIKRNKTLDEEKRINLIRISTFLLFSWFLTSTTCNPQKNSSQHICLYFTLYAFHHSDFFWNDCINSSWQKE